MTITTVGWRGTISDVEIAELMTLAGARATVAAYADWRPTAVAGNRQVSIAPGTGYAAFIVAKSDDDEIMTLPTPANGQWHLIVNRRNWANMSAVFMVLEGLNTTTAVPTATPTAFPGTFKDTPGIEYDQEVAWVWVNSANTTVRIWDLRRTPPTGKAMPGIGLLGNMIRGSFSTTGSGVTGAVDTLPAIVLDRPTRAMLHYSGRWASAANAAMYGWLEVNGVEVPGSRIRSANETFTNTAFPITTTIPATLSAGSNVVRFVISADSAGGSVVSIHTHLVVAEL